MATQLDLQEQEQLDALKAFWNQYGNLITWVLVAACWAPIAAWNGWNWYQRDQARQGRRAVRRARAQRAQAGDADSARRVFADLKDRYGRTAFAAAGRPAGGQGAVRQGPGRRRRAPAWPGSPSKPATRRLRAVARLRLAGAAARGQAVRRGAASSWTPRRAAGFAGAGGRPPRRRAAGAGQDGRGAQPPTRRPGRRLGEQARLPAPRRGQADGAGRRAAAAAPLQEPRRDPRRRLLALAACWRCRLAAGRLLRRRDKPKPTPLETVTPQIAGRVVWQARLGRHRLPAARRRPRRMRFVVAGGDGTVLALDAEQRRASCGAPRPARRCQRRCRQRRPLRQRRHARQRTGRVRRRRELPGASACRRAC